MAKKQPPKAAQKSAKQTKPAQTKPAQTKPAQTKPAQTTPAQKPSKPEPAPLVVEVDGKPLPRAEADETWRAFSAHMDDHQGDLAGFAQARGWKSVAPTYRRGSAVLLVTTR